MTTVFNQQVAETIYNSALEDIKKISPHFIPVTYACVRIVDSRPTDRYVWINPEIHNNSDLKKHASLAQEYGDDHVKFCIENYLSKDQCDDVMIVIVGIVPMNESVAPDCDEDTPESVRKNDTRLILDAHCYFQSALK